MSVCATLFLSLPFTAVAASALLTTAAVYTARLVGVTRSKERSNEKEEK